MSSTPRMNVLIFLMFSLYHFTVVQTEESISQYDYSSNSKVIAELLEVKNILTEQKTLLFDINKQMQQLGTTCSGDILNELSELKSTVQDQKIKIEALQKQAADKRIVAFSASLVGHGGQTIGGLQTEVVLKFQKIFINTGNAYNHQTGKFTAPVKGVYYFAFSAFANGQHSMGVHLRKNGEQIVATYDYNNNHKDVNGANRAILQLEKGDEVYIGLWKGLHIFDSYNSVSTFSGFLISTL